MVLERLAYCVPPFPGKEIKPLFMRLLLSHFSRVRLFATPWTAAYQAPPSTGFSRQEDWSGVPLPSPATLYTPPPIRELYMKATIKGRAFACKAIIARLKTVQSFHPFNFVIPYSREESVVSSGRLVSKFLWKCLLCASACSHISIPGT